MKKISRAVMLTGMNRYLRLLVLAAFAFTLAACGTMRSSVVFVPSGNRAPVSHTGTTGQLTPPPRTAIPGGSYAVVQGDTLYSIAFRKDVDFRDLAQWNGIAAPYTIWPGQSLRLSPGAVNAVPRVASSGAITATASAPVFEPVTPVAAPATTPVTTPETPAASMVVTTTPPPAPVAAAVANVAKPVAAVEVPVAGVPSTPPPPPQVVTPVGASHAAGGVTWRWPAAGSVIKRFKSSDAIPGIQIAGKSGDQVRSAADGVVVYSGNGLVGYGELVIIKHNDSFLSAYGHNRKRLVKEGQQVKAGQQVAEMGSTGATRNELEFQIRKNGNPVDPMLYLPAQ